MRKIILSALILLNLSAVMIYSQHQISGSIKDGANGSPVSFSTAALLRPDSSVIKGVMAGEDGKFVIDNVAAGDYLLQVSSLGYGKTNLGVNIPSQSSLGDIILAEDVTLLGEVVVRTSSRIVQKSDRLVFIIENENLTKGRNSHELLKFTPMLRTNQSNKIEMIGKDGVELYINNRKTTMSDNEINAYLSTLPADRIASIEVITDPGVTMRTGGTNKGIINLILKKNEANGMNGSLSVNDKQGRLNSPDAGLYLNYQKDKLNVSANVSASTYNTKVSGTSDFYFTESNIRHHLDNNNKTNNIDLNGMIRADYSLSDNQTLGLVYSIYYADNKNERTDITGFGRIGESAVDSVLRSDGIAKTPLLNQSFNLNYRLKTSNKGNLSVDAYYLRNERKQTFDNSTGYLSESIPFDKYRQKTEEPMNNYSGKIEYAHTFGPGNILTFGSEAYRSTAESDFFYGNMNSNGIYESDPQKSNDFSYRESYGGAYISYMRVWNAKFNSRIELVGEHIGSKGLQRVTSEEIVRKDYNILPTVSLMYQFNHANRIAYNFSTMAPRPGFYSLNPFRFYLTPTTYKEYNPNLKPARLYINTLNYTLKGHYTFSLNYLYIDKCTNNFLIPVDGQYTKYINANYGTAEMVNGVFVWNKSFWKNRVPVNASLSGTYQKSKGAVESIVVDAKGFFYNVSVNTGVRLSDRYDWNLTSEFSYYSKLILAQENVSDQFNFSIGIKKNFANKMSLNFGVKNLLYKLPTRDKTNDNFAYHTNTDYDTRQAYIGLTIPFGNVKAKGASNRNASSTKVSSRLKE